MTCVMTLVRRTAVGAEDERIVSIRLPPHLAGIESRSRRLYKVEQHFFAAKNADYLTVEGSGGTVRWRKEHVVFEDLIVRCSLRLSSTGSASINAAVLTAEHRRCRLWRASFQPPRAGIVCRRTIRRSRNDENPSARAQGSGDLSYADGSPRCTHKTCGGESMPTIEERDLRHICTCAPVDEGTANISPGGRYRPCGSARGPAMCTKGTRHCQLMVGEPQVMRNEKTNEQGAASTAWNISSRKPLVPSSSSCGMSCLPKYGPVPLQRQRSSAAEAALKMAFQYRDGRNRRRGSSSGYHARLIALLAAWIFAQMYKPGDEDTIHVEAPDCYRCPSRRVNRACSASVCKRSPIRVYAVMIVELLLQGSGAHLTRTVRQMIGDVL